MNTTTPEARLKHKIKVLQVKNVLTELGSDVLRGIMVEAIDLLQEEQLDFMHKEMALELLKQAVEGNKVSFHTDEEILLKFT